MTKQYYKIKPIFLEKIWGGKNLENIYEYQPKEYNLGEVWVFSAHEKGDTPIIINDKEEVMLADFLLDNYEQFGLKPNTLPIIQLRLVDAANDLSVQLHPDGNMANKYGETNGKTETWFFIKCSDDSSLLMDCDREVAEQFKLDGEVEKLIEHSYKCQTKEGDIYHIEAGTVHALGGGNFVLEVSEPSNTTYRVYDYNRLDINGNPRELHVEKSKEAIKPNVSKMDIKTKCTTVGNTLINKTEFVDVYTCEEIRINGNYLLSTTEIYKVIYIKETYNLTINGTEVNGGEAYLIPINTDIQFEGKGEVIVAYE